MIPVQNQQNKTIGFIEEDEFRGWIAKVFESGSIDDEASSSCWKSKSDAIRWVQKNGAEIKEAA